MDNFNIIYYINLDERTDRNESILYQLNGVNADFTKVKRVSAVKNAEMPYLGCAISHLKCLEDLENNNYKNCLILEDDFLFRDFKYAKISLNNFFEQNLDWDVLMLSGNTRQIQRSSIHNLAQVINVQTTSGYAVNRQFISTLKDNISESIQKLKEGQDPNLYCIDQNWKKLQQYHNWYILYPKIGYQQDGYSDIERKMVSYLDKYEVNMPYNYKYVLGILTCKENLNKAQKQFDQYLQNIDKYPIICIRFYGDPNLETEWSYNQKEKTLIIKCDDDYLNLPNKVFKFLKIVRALFPSIIGIFKTDEDIEIHNVDKLYQIMEKNKDIPYYGRFVMMQAVKSDYLQGKTFVTTLYPELKDYPVYLEEGTYCAGGGYYLNKNAIDVILQKETLFKPFPKDNYMDYLIDKSYFKDLCVFEDKNIGVALYRAGIYPQDKRGELLTSIRWDGI